MPRRVHFIGIGGTGMSGLAQILLLLGYQVSGSDLNSTPVTRRLESLGGICYTGHATENIGDAELVVISSAIRPDNPELIQAKLNGVQVVHRSDLLAWLMSRQKGLAVAGCHGKTTTTSMLGLVLKKNGLDPTILVGGELNDIGGNAKLGSGRYLVAEADESDGSFLKLEPLAAIITNIEDDHLDYYGSIDNIKEAFRRFLEKIPVDGAAVICLDDPNICEIIGGCKGTVFTYGIRSKADFSLKRVCLDGFQGQGEVYFRNRHLGRLQVPVPGEHNLSNALAVTAIAYWLGLEFEQIATALKDFRGVGRRFQLIGEVNGIKVVDDYAHHPSEIQVTLRTARQIHDKRLIAVFQPHRYTRTLLLKDRFGAAFIYADVIVVSEIYGAGETPIEGVTARLIVDAIEKYSGKQVIFCQTNEEVVEYLKGITRQGDLVLTIGAGNVWTAGVNLIRELKGEPAHVETGNL